MMEVTMQSDEDVFSTSRRTPDEFVRGMRLAAAIQCYEHGEISQVKAAQIAGLDRTDFLVELARRGEEAFIINFDDLQKELARG